MKAKYYILCAVSLIFIFVYFFLGKQQEIVRDYDEIRQQGILRVVTEYGELGYMPDLENDTARGFQHGLLRMLADSLNLKIEILVENSFDKSVKALKRGDYDLIAKNIPITTELREKIAFTDPILKNRQVLVQRNRRANNNVQPIRNQLDLGGKTLYVPQNSPFLLRLRNLAKEIGDSIYIEHIPNYEAEQLIILVAKGDIDFAVTDEWTAKNAQRNFPEIDILTAIGFTQPEAWAVRKSSPELLEIVNFFINSQLESGEINKLYQKYK